MFYVYMLKRSDESLYVGHTDNLEGRFAAHQSRRYCGYTATRLPVTLIFAGTFSTRDDAFAFERQVKGWSRAKKFALARGDWTGVSRGALRRTPQPAERQSDGHPGVKGPML